MVNRKAAKRYAKALFEVAVARDEVEQVERELELVCQALAATPELAALLRHPLLGAGARDELARAAFGERVSRGMLTLLDLLIEHRRTELLPTMREMYSELSDEHRGIVRAEVQTAVPLTDPQRQRLTDLIRRGFARQVVLTELVRPEILGGGKVRVGDLLLDGSIKTRLEVMREHLKQVRVRAAA